MQIFSQLALLATLTLSMASVCCASHVMFEMEYEDYSPRTSDEHTRSNEEGSEDSSQDREQR